MRDGWFCFWSGWCQKDKGDAPQIFGQEQGVGMMFPCFSWGNTCGVESYETFPTIYIFNVEDSWQSQAHWCRKNKRCSAMVWFSWQDLSFIDFWDIHGRSNVPCWSWCWMFFFWRWTWICLRWFCYFVPWDKSSFVTTIWENIYVHFVQASKSSKSKKIKDNLTQPMANL